MSRAATIAIASLFLLASGYVLIEAKLSSANERAKALASSICSAATPGTSIEALKTRFSRPPDQLQISESPTGALFVARGFQTFIFYCQIKAARGIVISARYAEDS